MSQSESTKLASTADIERAEKIRKRCGRFRILIIGRANAGKTTVLQRICNTTEMPKIYGGNGEEVS